MEWVNTILQGVLLGGLYAMFAAGLALIFGVMRLVNIAHGDLIVLAAYVALTTVQALGVNPLLSLVIVEQDIVQALKSAKHVYCLQEGRVALEGQASALTREKISAAYFGV